MVDIRYRGISLSMRFSISVTTMREVFYGVISQGVAPHFFIMESKKICSFFGHRTIIANDDLYAATTTEILKAVDFGCRTFYFGGFGEFDALCYQIVTKMKHEHPDLGIERIFCVPQERDLHKKSRLYRRESYDDVVYLCPSFDGWYKSIYFRNCAMIDQSDVVIVYAEERKDSGAYKAYQYAKKKKGKSIVNLWNL